ncbi:uncharacterized protein L969DRAFT_90095 [Mixia osmundae IAM 14324]|uniref:uncharacterized protein n=1 Tax=Mixia osmundae (strain CBS 9802 / IAM 14324 / JCM 22182 / KY 12970) TaxID=764103 RepID=UPI0004A55278|nr:uncharacterized protein L969DRAFT_90095 [Mixia osmundae IAM 14324]KEI37032.1 hypothetical protein L969DRAFT_90095 [Mixia osmundae IAM 14324]
MSESYINLLHDLHLPASSPLPASLPTVLAYHLATLPLPQLTHLCRVLLQSACLWSKTGDPQDLVHYERGQEIYRAIQRGFLGRVDHVSQEQGPGWRGRRQLANCLDAVLQALDGSDESEQASSSSKLQINHPVRKLVVASGCLSALQAVKERQDSLYVGGKSLMGRAENETLILWAEVLEYMTGTTPQLDLTWTSNDHRRPGDLLSSGPAVSTAMSLPTYLAAQTLPIVDSAKLGALPVAPLISMLTTTIESCFDNGRLFDGLDDDLIETVDGLAWNSPSSSQDRLDSLLRLPLYPELGRVSRLLGNLFAAPGAELEYIESSCLRLLRLVARVEASWRRCRWSDVTKDTELASTTRLAKQPWTHHKTLLFTLTMIHSALMTLLTSTPSQVGRPPAAVLDLTSLTLQTFSKVYFVTQRFGPDGFGAYLNAWHGALDLCARASSDDARAIITKLEPRHASSQTDREVDRACLTYYLNVAEQLMETLPDDYVESHIMPMTRRYLDDARYADAFDSAHSVVLAVFAKNKRCSIELMPWYSDLVLRSYPEMMTSSQIRLAYTTMVKRASEVDDALAWYCVAKLIKTIQDIPPHALEDTNALAASDVPRESNLASLSSSEAVQDALGRSQHEARFERDSESDDKPEDVSTRLDDVAGPSPLESHALSLRRGHLLLVLIDLIPAVNLTLLLTLLDTIAQLIQAEGHTGERAGAARLEGKDAIVKVLFATLGEGMDSIKRQAGAHWWMQHRTEL